ncbi:hypothetical protein SAMN05216588_101247 [Pseudomonas flavescens]|uniref:Uncharacterized protein n=1 Tax=Phytopseudomonas flavescens TaxID=29435 RepID=A0A1G7XT76_9GAMM|nr:hypothetical protein SAMN05216588_101247 [Pseudomonas flavescens]
MIREATTFHVSLAITYVIARARRPRALDGTLHDRATGRPLTGEEVLTVARQCAEKGYEVIPSCDHVGSKGECLGHPAEASA